MIYGRFIGLGAVCLLAACGNRATEPGREGQGGAAPTPPAAHAPAKLPGTATMPAVEEACAQIIVVAWQGAERAPESVTRDEDAARAKIEQLRARLERGEEFSAVARAESDAPVTRARGGVAGTWTRDRWPTKLVAIRDPVFRLGVSQLSEPLRLPNGWAIVRRCPVQKIHTRHILIRFAGATNAPSTLTRTREQAQQMASEIHDRIAGRHEDFAAIARAQSEDSSSTRGGDLGLVARGLFAPAYEEAAWALATGAVSQVVETEFGFHVIQRLP